VNTLIVGLFSEKAKTISMKIDGIEDNGLKDSIKTFIFKETNSKTIEGDFQAIEAPLIYKHRCSLDDIS
jgi:hypothetical protein